VATPTPSQRVGAVVLAAGASRRLGRSKARVVVPCAPSSGQSSETLLRRAARLALSVVAPGPVIVVVPADDVGLAALVAGLGPGVETLPNAEAAEGMAASIRKGIAELEARGVVAALLTTVDQPLLTPDDLRALVALVAGSSAAAPAAVTMAAAAYADRVGVPAVFARAWFVALRALEGDRGARQLLQQAPAGALRTLPLPDAALDLDTEEAVRALLDDESACRRLRSW
jgi:molybdenum cofactor cytidylyltransferase